MDRIRLQRSLIVLEAVGLLTLLRSVAYDRWITVLASLILLVGVAAANRGRTWGVALSFAAAMAFPVAWMIGIAPLWFALVGVVGAMPYAIASKAFARFDKGATAVLTVAAASTGALAAVAWKEYAWAIIATFPSLRPSLAAQHGLAVTAILVSAVVAMRFRRAPLLALADEQRVRVASQVRVAEGASEDREVLAPEENDAPSKTETYERRRASL